MQKKLGGDKDLTGDQSSLSLSNQITKEEITTNENEKQPKLLKKLSEENIDLHQSAHRKYEDSKAKGFRTDRFGNQIISRKERIKQK